MLKVAIEYHSEIKNWQATDTSDLKRVCQKVSKKVLSREPNFKQKFGAVLKVLFRESDRNIPYL